MQTNKPEYDTIKPRYSYSFKHKKVGKVTTLVLFANVLKCEWGTTCNSQIVGLHIGNEL